MQNIPAWNRGWMKTQNLFKTIFSGNAANQRNSIYPLNNKKVVTNILNFCVSSFIFSSQKSYEANNRLMADITCQFRWCRNVIAGTWQCATVFVTRRLRSNDTSSVSFRAFLFFYVLSSLTSTKMIIFCRYSKIKSGTLPPTSSPLGMRTLCLHVLF